MTAAINSPQPFYVGDFGGTIQLTIRDQTGALVTCTGTVNLLFQGVCSGTKSATIDSAGVVHWVITSGFFTQAGEGEVRAQVLQAAAAAAYLSDWVSFRVAN